MNRCLYEIKPVKMLVVLFVILFSLRASAQDWQLSYQPGVDNQSSTLTLPTQTVSTSTACTNASPSVFTWTSNPLVNGMAIVLSGTPCTGFTAGTTYYVVAKATNSFELAATVGGTAINGTSAQTPTSTIVVPTNALLASNNTVGSVTVPSFSNATRAANGSFTGRRIRLVTNATSGWDQATFTVRLWSAAPTYTSYGNGQPYNVGTGASSLLGSFNIVVSQFGDGAAGQSGVIDGGAIYATLVSAGPAVYWDLQYTGLTSINMGSAQTFTATLEEQK